MKKIMTALAVTAALCFSMSVTAHASEMLDRDYIESEIWEDMWLGKDDNGTDFPEASFKYHLLDGWLNENYGCDEYDWSALGELKYSYQNYYNTLIENWNFNDDENGNWTIDTQEHSYHFHLISNTWNMIDENGDTVDMFPPFSTEEEKDVPLPGGNSPDNNGYNSNRVIGQVAHTEESANVETEESQPETKSGSAAIPLMIGGIAVIGAGAVLLILRKKKK